VLRIPYWLTLGLGLLICVWGVYRIRIAFRDKASDERAKQRGGLYAMARRTHALVGLVYVMLGAALIATSFGWNPMGGMFGPGVAAPKAGAEPTSSGVPVDQLPAAKK
jgi:protein-S-isoprenylcysteine O-methyltransferase Ste14